MFIDLMRNRRSIRKFKDKEVEQEKIDILIEAMLRSPSSRSLNPWHFVVVNEPNVLAGLAKAKPHGGTFIKDAPLAIVICADPDKCDVWIEDCSIAAIIVHIAAVDLGLGSCWVQIRLRDHGPHLSAEEYCKKIIGLPDHMVVEAVVAVGYPGEEKKGRPYSSLPFDRVHYNCHGRYNSV